MEVGYHRILEDRDDYICMTGRVVGDYVHRFHLQNHDNTTLTIHNVGFNDTGIYHCIEYDAAGSRIHTMYLSVFPKPSDDVHTTCISRVESTPASDSTCKCLFEVRILLILTVAVLLSNAILILITVTGGYFRNLCSIVTVRQRSRYTTADEENIGLMSGTGSINRFVGTAEVAHVIKRHERADVILGLALLGSDLYILRTTAAGNIEIWTVTATDDGTITSSLSGKYRPTLRGLGSRAMADMAVCKIHKCLYLTDDDNDYVHKVLVRNMRDPIIDATGWSVQHKPVTSRSELLVTCREERRLKLFSTDGALRMDIELPGNCLHPWHAIQLSSGRFVVSHGHKLDSLHRVSSVAAAENNKSQILRSYGGSAGSAQVGQLNWPSHLAVDKDGFVYVADCNNGRVLLLSPTLEYEGVIAASDEFRNSPRRLCLDADNELLYVADCLQTSGQVVLLRLNATVNN